MTVLLEVWILVENHGRKENASVFVGVLQDMTELFKIMGTTVLPVLMLTWGGGSFCAVIKMQPGNVGCNLAKLKQVTDETPNLLTFQCRDGYVPTDIQEHIDAWAVSASRRLRVRAHIVHHHGNATIARVHAKGYVAPIFESITAYREGQPPLAWAVKAGQPVKVAPCAEFPRGVCGILVNPLRDLWMSYKEAPGFVRLHFGDAWGFNITQFEDKHMKAGALAVQQKHPRSDWGGIPGSPEMPFVIAENVTTYVGMAVPLLWVSIALMGAGCIDRLAVVAEAKKKHSGDADDEEDEDENGDPRNHHYNHMPIVEASAIEVEEERGLGSEVWAMWNDPLNTPRPIAGTAGTLSIHGNENANGTRISPR